MKSLSFKPPAVSTSCHLVPWALRHLTSSQGEHGTRHFARSHRHVTSTTAHCFGCSRCHRSLAVPDLHAGLCRRCVRVGTHAVQAGRGTTTASHTAQGPGKGGDCTQDTPPPRAPGSHVRQHHGHWRLRGGSWPGSRPRSGSPAAWGGTEFSLRPVPHPGSRCQRTVCNTHRLETGTAALLGRVVLPAAAGALVGLGNCDHTGDGQGPLRLKWAQS